jgi:hypothetical protein
MDTLAELMLPIEHGAPGAHGAQGRRGTWLREVSVDCYIDMPLHLIPPFVPVDLPSRKVSVYIGVVCVWARTSACMCKRAEYHALYVLWHTIFKPR